MCGIVGIISDKNEIAVKLVNSLKCLEYRGYDSAGVALLKDSVIGCAKKTGRIKDFDDLAGDKLEFQKTAKVGIAHTRWATHGEANTINAHPHLSMDGKIAVVHNGIIENYLEIKKELSQDGYIFKSQTDTEVIAHLVDFYKKSTGNNREAFLKAIARLNGSFGVAVIFNDEEKIYVAKNGSPLFLGIGEGEYYVASAPSAFSGLTTSIIALEDGETATLSPTGYEVFNGDGKLQNKKIETMELDDTVVDKGNYPHFMLKEIYEQPKVLERTMAEYLNKDTVMFPDFDFAGISELTIVACGTSYYAGCVAKYFIEEMTGVPVSVDIASEFRYRHTPLRENGTAIFISQSGETADTIAALKYCKERGQKIISIVNVIHSTIALLSDVVLKTMAGVEIGVASTKAFTAQISLLWLMALEMAKAKGKITTAEHKKELEQFRSLPVIMEKFFADKESMEHIKSVAQTIHKSHSLVYVGRNILYPIALEGALKIEELSYIPTQGIASGELKHGPIALVDENSYIIALSSSSVLFDKTMSSLEEMAARKGKIISIADAAANEAVADKIYTAINVPIVENSRFGLLVCMVPAVQLLAYETALAKGLDIDKPRNLAKSVTVE